MAESEQITSDYSKLLTDRRITTEGERERGLAVLQRLRQINIKHDNEVYQNWGNNRKIAQLIKDVVSNFVECIQSGKSFITQDVLLDTSFDLRDLDPACMFIIRAICGPTVFSDSVLRRVRSSWCPDDLPSTLFDLLQIRDDAEFKNRLFSYRFTWQEKTEAFAKSGLF